jgi:hypothetical protein
MQSTPSPSARRITWYIDGTAWRLEYLTGRWQLSRYVTATETWQRVGSYPSRTAAVEAAYGQNGDQDA